VSFGITQYRPNEGHLKTGQRTSSSGTFCDGRVTLRPVNVLSREKKQQIIRLGNRAYDCLVPTAIPNENVKREGVIHRAPRRVLALKSSPAPWLMQANGPPGATEAQLNAMLRNLLVERFHLMLHHEIKDMAVYQLTMAKKIHCHQ
jgi:hypothetical protein